MGAVRLVADYKPIRVKGIHLSLKNVILYDRRDFRSPAPEFLPKLNRASLSAAVTTPDPGSATLLALRGARVDLIGVGVNSGHYIAVHATGEDSRVVLRDCTFRQCRGGFWADSKSEIHVVGCKFRKMAEFCGEIVAGSTLIATGSSFDSSVVTRLASRSSIDQCQFEGVPDNGSLSNSDALFVTRVAPRVRRKALGKQSCDRPIYGLTDTAIGPTRDE